MELIEQSLKIGAFLSPAELENAEAPGILTEADAQIINGFNPPVPVKAGEAYVRQCRLFGAVINSYYFSPRPQDMALWLKLAQGAPLLVGHDDWKEPIGKFFGGEVVKYNGASYIAPKFYWMRNLSYAEDLRIKIDSGIISEASIYIQYNRPTCSICGNDIRDIKRCPHFPGHEYEGELCFYWADGPERVLEGSIVYRGAVPGTGYTMPEALRIALDAKQKNLEIKKAKGTPQMEYSELLEKLGLSADVTETQLKDKIQAGERAVKDLESTKLKLAELESFKTKAEPVLGARREEALRLLNLLHNNEPDKLLVDTLANASPEKVEEYIKDLGAKLEKALPLKCADCGSTNIQARSSVDAGVPDSTDTPKQESVNVSGFKVNK